MAKGWSKSVISAPPERAPRTRGRTSAHAVRVGPLVFVTGQSGRRPGEDPLWALDNAHVTMHLSGRAQDKMFARSADRFIANLELYLKGDPVGPRFDPRLGY